MVYIIGHHRCLEFLSSNILGLIKSLQDKLFCAWEKEKKLVSINEVVLDMLRLPPWGFKRLDMEMRKICGICSHANCQGINAILFTHKNNSKSICIVQPCMFLYIQLIDILLPCKMFYSKTVILWTTKISFRGYNFHIKNPSYNRCSLIRSFTLNKEMYWIAFLSYYALSMLLSLW